MAEPTTTASAYEATSAASFGPDIPKPTATGLPERDRIFSTTAATPPAIFSCIPVTPSRET